MKSMSKMQKKIKNKKRRLVQRLVHRFRIDGVNPNGEKEGS